MSKLLAGLGLVLICLTGCKKNSEDLGQTTNNSQDRTSRELHNYTYNENGNILTDNEVIYDLINEKVIDTTITTSRYVYEAGKLIKILIQSEVPELSKTKLFTYDSRDSLTLELWIELNGDTTYFNKSGYDKNGNKVTEETRKLWDRRTFEEIKENPSKMAYDTMYLKWENEFRGGNCVLSRSINKIGETESEVIFTYQNGKKIKAETYKYLGPLKYPYSTQNYDYTEYEKGEYSTVDKDGFPLESLSVVFRNGRLYKKTIMFSDYLLVQFFDDSGRLIKEADISNKRVTDYTYDTKGNKKEVFTFPMPDTNFTKDYDSLKSLVEAAQN